FTEAVRLGEDRRRNPDFLAVCEMPDHVGRSVRCRSETCAELDQRLGFDPLDEMEQNVVEDLDLLFAEAVGIAQKQVGDPPQRLGPPFRRAVFERVLELVDDRNGRVRHFVCVMETRPEAHSITRPIRKRKRPGGKLMDLSISRFWRWPPPGERAVQLCAYAQ